MVSLGFVLMFFYVHCAKLIIIIIIIIIMYARGSKPSNKRPGFEQ